MTRKERRDYILALNKVVNRWKANSNLFAGGCCFFCWTDSETIGRKRHSLSSSMLEMLGLQREESNGHCC